MGIGRGKLRTIRSQGAIRPTSTQGHHISCVYDVEVLKGELCFVTGPYSALRCFAHPHSRDGRPRGRRRCCTQHNAQQIPHLVSKSLSALVRVHLRWCTVCSGIVVSDEQTSLVYIRVRHLRQCRTAAGPGIGCFLF